MWDEREHVRCFQLVQKLVSNRGCEENPIGLAKNKSEICALLSEFNFEIQQIPNPDAEYRPIVIARRLSSTKKKTIGFFGHYDVETANQDEWENNPWELSVLNGRWYGRGVADNLVPLVHRILLSDVLAKHCNIVYVLQGEEEIGSPFAMSVYPKLDFSDVDMWIEETGYFYKNGDHRIMIVNENELLRSVIDGLTELNYNIGINTRLRNRPMNKAFGNQGCPCLVHLLGDTPYIALGPNDDYCTIHGIDETINPAHFKTSALQILSAFEAVANG